MFNFLRTKLFRCTNQKNVCSPKHLWLFPETSIADPHWFQWGSGSRFLNDQKQGEKLQLKKIIFSDQRNSCQEIAMLLLLCLDIIFQFKGRYLNLLRTILFWFCKKIVALRGRKYLFSQKHCDTFMQCCGSMTFWCGSGSGYADPCLWLMDPDSDPGSGSCYFCHLPSRCQQKTNFL